MKTAISYTCCDKMDLVRQSVAPLVEAAIKHRFHLFVCDGSRDPESEKVLFEIAYPTATIHDNIRGGAGAAYVYALTMMLDHTEGYDYVGLVESDVLLKEDWYERALALFGTGESDGLPVGAVSARTYDDRVLLQRPDYAVLHNAGAGMVIFSRPAARLALDHLRTACTLDNRRIFATLSGIDIGRYWAFRGAEQRLVADWHWDAMLAANGYATLGLVPSPTDMIGQDPPLPQQGLRISDKPVTSLVNDKAFDLYVQNLNAIRDGRLRLGVETQFEFDPNTATWTYFPHQLHMLGGKYEGNWTFKERRGWGTFVWIAGDDAVLTVPVFGAVNVVCTGGEVGGTVELYDTQSHYKVNPQLLNEVDGQLMMVTAPAGMAMRELVVKFTPGTMFYGLQSREKQPVDPTACTFDHTILPPAG